jgi:hypothetical protein
MKCPNCGYRLSSVRMARALASKAGRRGGAARAAKETKAQRSARMRRVVMARWKKAKK